MTLAGQKRDGFSRIGQVAMKTKRDKPRDPRVAELLQAIESYGYRVEKEMARKEVLELVNTWQNVVAPCFAGSGGRYVRHGARAFQRYLSQEHAGLYVVSLLGSRGIPNACADRNLPIFGFRIVGQCSPPDLTAYHMLEFSITDLQFNWTFIHTHEDYGYGGPYFVPLEGLEEKSGLA
jgi:hypothetical protein